jgi:hypothetical protein
METDQKNQGTTAVTGSSMARSGRGRERMRRMEKGSVKGKAFLPQKEKRTSRADVKTCCQSFHHGNSVSSSV